MAYARPPPPSNGAHYGGPGGYGNGGGYQQDWRGEDYGEYSANPYSQGGPPPPQQQGYSMPRPHPNEQQGYDQYNRPGPPPRGDSRAGGAPPPLSPPQQQQPPYGYPPTAPPNRPLPQRDRYDQGPPPPQQQQQQPQHWDNQPPRDYGRPSTSQGNYAPPPGPHNQSNFDFGWSNGGAHPPRPSTSQDVHYDGYGARPPVQQYSEPTSAPGHYGGGQSFNLPERPGTAPSRDPYGNQAPPPDNRPYAHHMNGNGSAPYPGEEMPNFANAPKGPNARPADPYSQDPAFDQRHMSPPYAQGQGQGQGLPPPRPHEPHRQDTYYSDPGYNDGYGNGGNDGDYGYDGYGADSYGRGPPPDSRTRRDPRDPRDPRGPPPRGGSRGRGPSRGGHRDPRSAQDPRDPRDPRGRREPRDPRDPRGPRGRDAPSRGASGMDPRGGGRRPPPPGRMPGPNGSASESRSGPNGPSNGAPGGRPGAPNAGAPGGAAIAGANTAKSPTGVPGQPKDPQRQNEPSTANGQNPTSPTSANPDSLPSHPTPVRPGLMQNGGSKEGNDRPPPVRQYTNTTAAPRQSGSSDRRSMPVTAPELESLRQQAASRPQDGALGLKLAKKLIEASTVLASENGRADPRTTAKNRERYVLEAHKLLKKLAATENADAQFYLADCLGTGALGLENDPKEAFQLYQSAAKLRHAQAAYRTAICCEIGPEEGGGTRKDPTKAIQWYKRAANLGDIGGMYKSGMICLEGLLGSERNPAEGVAWLQRAVEKADADHPHALHKLGQLHENPAALGYQAPLPRDDARAFQLFSQAAKYGYKFSQFKLGQAYEYGMLGAPIDARQSIIWYTKAAAQGEHQSELALSGWYLTGSEGMLEHSDTEAYLWARKAATGDPPLPKALFALGYYTEVGIGCPRSLEEAKKWYGRAAAYKFPKAQERLEELRRGGAKAQKNRERLSRSNQKQAEESCTVM